MAKMERPNNILNSAADASHRTNTQIKTLVFWWSGITLFYLWGGLEVSKEVNLAIISVKGLTQPKFLFGLLILNVVFWVRLIWRIIISCRYNKIYYDSVRECVCNGGYAEEYMQNRYEKNMRCFNSREKWVVGLGVPLVLGFVAIVWLSYCLAFVSLPCLKIVFCLEVVALAILLLVVPLVLQCEYLREAALQKFLEEKKTSTRLFSGEKKAE